MSQLSERPKEALAGTKHRLHELDRRVVDRNDGLARLVFGETAVGQFDVAEGARDMAMASGAVHHHIKRVMRVADSRSVPDWIRVQLKPEVRDKGRRWPDLTECPMTPTVSSALRGNQGNELRESVAEIAGV